MREFKFQIKALATCIFSFLLVCSGCKQIPEGIVPIEDVIIEKYAGTWYEIERLDNRFEKHLSRVTATYNLKDEGMIEVVNRGYDTVKNEWNEIKGKAKVPDPEVPGALEVSFFGPFYSGYNIIALDTVAYQYAMVCGADRDYLWILSRTPTMPAPLVDSLKNHANTLGFEVDLMIEVQQP